jgi:hypothetical protein
MSETEQSTQTETTQSGEPGATTTLLNQETPLSNETKPDPGAGEGDKTLLTKDEPKEGAKPSAGAPEKYEDFKVPEGYELDNGVLGEAAPLFKELGLTQEGAQKLVDLYSKHAIETAQAAAKSYRDMRAAWVSKAKALPEIGTEIGLGKKVNVTIAKALDGLGDPALTSEFKAAMDQTGAGDNPAFIRVFYALASKLVEGGPVKGNGPSSAGQKEPGGGRKTAAAEIWPNLPSAGA